MYIGIHLLLLLFSLVPVCMKYASINRFLSLPFMLYFGTAILIMAFYALAWQQIIKILPLTTAYANRAATVVWGMIWGCLLFKETLSLMKLLGVLVIVVGIVLFATAQSEGETTHE